MLSPTNVPNARFVVALAFAGRPSDDVWGPTSAEPGHAPYAPLYAGRPTSGDGATRPTPVERPPPPLDVTTPKMPTNTEAASTTAPAVIHRRRRRWRLASSINACASSSRAFGEESTSVMVHLA